MTKIVVITPENVPSQIRIVNGMLISMVSTSRDSRLMMRPSGVVSKNDIGARNTALSKSRCKIRAELTAEIANPKANPKTLIADKKKTKKQNNQAHVNNAQQTHA